MCESVELAREARARDVKKHFTTVAMVTRRRKPRWEQHERGFKQQVLRNRAGVLSHVKETDKHAEGRASTLITTYKHLMYHAQKKEAK